MARVVIEMGSGAPFAWAGSTSRRNVAWTLGCLALLAAVYAAVYRWQFLPSFAGYLVLGMALDGGMNWLASGRLTLPGGSGALTAALLACSVPPDMPFAAMFIALAMAIVLVRASTSSTTIRLNRMLVARLILMLAFNSAIVDWPAPVAGEDAIATATPIELYHAEEYLYPLASLLRGSIRGDWESLYQVVPGSPGEGFAPLLLLLWLLLARMHVVEWRVGAAFLLAFCATHLVSGQPVLFHVFSGGVVFAAIFIAGDPASTPRSRLGRWAGGALAGVANALIRNHTNYSEGIVFSFLGLNLLSLALDRLAFALRGWTLRARFRRFAHTSFPGSPPAPPSSPRAV